MARSLFAARGGAPFSTAGWRKMVARLGVAAKLSFRVHPDTFRHACGFQLANQGTDTRTLQTYLGHRNIQHTVRYTQLSPTRFKNLWRDRCRLPMAATPTPTARYHASAAFIKCIFADAGYQGRSYRGRHRQTGTGSWRSSSAMNCIGSFRQTAVYASVTAGQQCQAALPKFLFLVGLNLPASFHHEVFGLRAGATALNSLYKSLKSHRSLSSDPPYHRAGADLRGTFVHWSLFSTRP